METYDKGFVLSDEVYKDNIHTHPYHFNAMRHKPVYPPTYIDNNIAQLRSFPEKWKSYNEPNNVSDKGRPHFSKRTLFYDADSGQHIHMSTLDTLGTQHMLDPNIKFPEEDQVLNTIGRKMAVYEKRNNIGEISPGDKPYRAVEYSKEYFAQANRNWRSDKFQMSRNTGDDQMTVEELNKLLGLNSSSTLFKPKFDLHYEHDHKWEEEFELNNVKSLDDWKPAPKLEVPFKVLDNPDKNFKYRPKITK
jgi:hypothetical protein